MKGNEKMAKIVYILESFREDRQNMTKMCDDTVAMVVGLVEEILLPEYVQHYGIFGLASALLGNTLR